MHNKRMNAMYSKRMNEEDVNEKEEPYLSGAQFQCKEMCDAVVGYHFPGGPSYPHYMA